MTLWLVINPLDGQEVALIIPLHLELFHHAFRVNGAIDMWEYHIIIFDISLLVTHWGRCSMAKDG